MNGSLKIKPLMFLAYDYDREEDYINSMSRKGWQLTKGGLLHHTYVKSEEEFRYKLDFNNKVHFNIDEHDRYLSIYDEQGWEHINSTFNGWHYFRKKFDPELKDEDYYIYTDDSSLQEMLGRWNRIARIFQAAFLLFFFYYLFYYFINKSLLNFLAAFLTLSAAALFQVGILNMRAKRIGSRVKPTLGSHGGYLLTGALLLSVLVMLYLSCFGYYTDKINYSAKIDLFSTGYSDTLKVAEDGPYKLDVKCKSEQGIILLQILRDSSVIYNAGGNNFKVTDKRISLEAGEYTVKAEYYPGDTKGMSRTTVPEKSYSEKDENKTGKVHIFVGIKR